MISNILRGSEAFGTKIIVLRAETERNKHKTRSWPSLLVSHESILQANARLCRIMRLRQRWNLGIAQFDKAVWIIKSRSFVDI